MVSRWFHSQKMRDADWFTARYPERFANRISQSSQGDPAGVRQ
jgi:hypothetical protein